MSLHRSRGEERIAKNMPDEFDPYYHWLGIPPHEQPPNHYRLLSLQLFEPHEEVIQNAVDRVMVHLRTFQTGQRARESQRLLNEVARAKLCLLDPAKKAAYDEQLRAELAGAMSPPPGPSSAPPLTPPADELRDVVELQMPVAVARHRHQRRSPGLILLAISTLLVLIATPLALFGLRSLFSDTTGEVDRGIAHGAPDPLPKQGDRQPETGKPAGATPSKQQGTQPDSGAGSPAANGSTGPHATGTTKTGRSAANPPRSKPEPPAFDRGSLDAAARSAIEQASGLVTDELALCQTLPLGSFPGLAERMRPFGYRPIRVRPYAGGSGTRVAAMWVRDGAPWQLKMDRDAEKMAATAEQLADEGLLPVDVAGYAVKDPRLPAGYVAVFCRSDQPSDSVRLLVGQEVSSRASNRQRMQRSRVGFAVVACQQFQDGAGETRCCEIWKKQTGPSARSWFRASGQLRRLEPIFLRIPAPFVPLDVTLWPRRTSTATQLRWSMCGQRAPRPFAVLSGYALEAHRTRSGELAGRGYVPASIAIADFGEEPLAVSVWHFPDRQPPAGQALAVQDAGRLPATPEPAPAEPAPTEPVAAADPPDAAPPAAEQPESKAVTRAAIPADAERNRARRELDDRYGTELGAAKNAPRRILLAERLIREADQAEDPALQYVLYDEACDLAAQAGHIELAFQSILHQAERFEVDALEAKAAITRKTMTATKLRSARNVLAWILFELSEQARREEKLELAGQLAASAGNAARTSRDNRLSRAASAQKRRIDAAEQLVEAAAKARAVLELVPDDPDASQAVGNYLCFVRGDWDRGLRLLSHAADAELADIARQDLDRPAGAAQQVALADEWAAWADGQEGEPQLAAQRRALEWYARAIPQLQDKELAAAEKKLDRLHRQIASWLWSGARRLPWLDGQPGTLRALPGPGAAVTSLDASANGRLAVIGYDRGTCRLWDVVSGRVRLENEQLVPQRADILLAGDGPFAVCSGGDRNLAVWNLNSGSERIQEQPHSIVRLAAAQFEPVYAWSSGSSRKNNVVIWDAGGRTAPQPLSFPGSVRCLQLSPDGRLLLIGSSKNNLITVDCATGQEVGRISLSASPRWIVVSPDGRFVAVALGTNIHVCSSLSGNPVCRIPSGHLQLAFLPGIDRALLAGHRPDELAVWNVTTGEQIHSETVRSPDSQTLITQIAALPDPRAVMVGTESGQVLLVRLPEVAVSDPPEKAGTEPSSRP